MLCDGVPWEFVGKMTGQSVVWGLGSAVWGCGMVLRLIEIIWEAFSWALALLLREWANDALSPSSRLLPRRSHGTSNTPLPANHLGGTPRFLPSPSRPRSL